MDLVLLLDDDLEDGRGLVHAPDVITNQEWGHLLRDFELAVNNPSYTYGQKGFMVFDSYKRP